MSSSSDVTIGLYDGILKALQDDSVQAVIIIGKGKVFCAGADITAFSKPIKGNLTCSTVYTKFNTIWLVSLNIARQLEFEKGDN